MSLTRFANIRIHREGEVTVLGLDQPKATVHSWHPGTQLLVIKVPGHKYWASRGSQGYAGAEFQVYEVIDDRTRGDEQDSQGNLWARQFRCRHIVSFPVGADAAQVTRVMHAAITTNEEALNG